MGLNGGGVLTDCCGRHILKGDVNSTKAILALALKRHGMGVCTRLFGPVYAPF